MHLASILIVNELQAVGTLVRRVHIHHLLLLAQLAFWRKWLSCMYNLTAFLQLHFGRLLYHHDLLKWCLIIRYVLLGITLMLSETSEARASTEDPLHQRWWSMIWIWSLLAIELLQKLRVLLVLRPITLMRCS